MQMKALRSPNFAKLSSSNSTSDAYWVTSMSAGTPAGYCLSQMRSILFPLLVCFLVFARLPGRDALFWAVLSNAVADGKRRSTLDGRRIKKYRSGAESAQPAIKLRETAQGVGPGARCSSGLVVDPPV